MSDTFRIAVAAIFGATAGITLGILVPAAWRALLATFKRRQTTTLDVVRPGRTVTWHEPPAAAIAEADRHLQAARESVQRAADVLQAAHHYEAVSRLNGAGYAITDARRRLAAPQEPAHG
jgi:hypothetical protein